MKKLALVIPAHNEEAIIKQNVEKTIAFLEKQKLPVEWEIIVAENGSKDKTVQILKDMKQTKHFSYLVLPARSRSAAIKQAWMKVDADYYMFMDADLATDIKHIPQIVKQAEKGYDIVIGSRRMKQSDVKRTLFRRFASHIFHGLLRTVFSIKVHDFQCGFKLISEEVRTRLIPQMKYDDEGFLDTELLVVANMMGYKIKEVPVKWHDDDDRPSRFVLHKQIQSTFVNAYKIKRDMMKNKYK